jgi:hypothetical protein
MLITREKLFSLFFSFFLTALKIGGPARENTRRTVNNQRERIVAENFS